MHFQLPHAPLVFALLFRQHLAHFRLGALLRLLFPQPRLVAGGAGPGSGLDAAGYNGLKVRQVFARG